MDTLHDMVNYAKRWPDEGGGVEMTSEVAPQDRFLVQAWQGLFNYRHQDLLLHLALSEWERTGSDDALREVLDHLASLPLTDKQAEMVAEERAKLGE